MGELKPIGSEKLKGEEQIKRILDLTYYQPNEVIKESSEVVKEAKSGVYGIVKEKDGYYVKKGLNENSLDYIGGMFMKNKNKFSSYSEALKKLDFLTEQEELQEATKYVLKQNKPPAPIAPAAEEPIAAPVDPVAPVDEPVADPAVGEEPMAGEDVEDPNDFMKVLKKMAGKLQEKFNKYEDRLESADYAEIIKQVLSAVDVEKLEETDIDDIMSVFEDDEVEGTTDFPTDGNGEVPPPSDTEAPIEEELPIVNDDNEGLPVDPLAQHFRDEGMGEFTKSDEVDEIDGMSMNGVASLDELINTPLDDEDDDILDGFSDEFLDDPEIKRAGKVATSDMVRDQLGDVSKFPKYGEEEELDELILNDPIDSDVNDVPSEASDENPVRELDLDELTNMVNNTVKHSLGKYFE